MYKQWRIGAADSTWKRIAWFAAVINFVSQGGVEVCTCFLAPASMCERGLIKSNFLFYGLEYLCLKKDIEEDPESSSCRYLYEDATKETLFDNC